MINTVHNYTLNYIESAPRAKRKKIGQFFTQPSIAEFMSSLAEWDKNNIRILDAGAGSGILAAALCQKCLDSDVIQNVHIDLYENNEDVIPVLKKSMEYVKQTMQVNNRSLTYNIIEENFILSNADFWNGNEERSDDELYDIIISNPPYRKINKSDKESQAMNNIVYGQPNIYFLFMAMSAKLLRVEGKMIFINPRSFTSGAYFRKFREWFLNNVKITNIHLFHSRDDVFNTDNILQEALILKVVKTARNINRITITTSPGATFKSIEVLEMPTNEIIDRNSQNWYILIPTNNEEVEILGLINSWTHTMPELGFKLSTGKVVDFRATEFLKIESDNYTVPLFWPCNLNNNRIVHPVYRDKSQQYILDVPNSKQLLIDNENYILVKRFTSKEETKRIQCALYFRDEFINHKRIGIENHLNYITKLTGCLTKEEMYGLFVVLNSTYVDKYYRILNGSTQVNASEMNSIPLPNIDLIKKIGKRAIINNNISVEFCDNVIRELFIDRIRHVV